MKKIFFAFVFTSLIQFAYSQNVGIGTNTPEVRLDVRSTDFYSNLAHFRNYSPGGFAQIMISNGGDTADIGVDAGGGYAGTNRPGDFRIRTGAVNRMFFVHNTGYVGIGTDYPEAPLHVAGSIRLTGDLQLDGRIPNETPWAPTLLNNWVNYGDTYAPARYYKDKESVVHFSGLVKNGTNSLLFQLGPSYRPSGDRIFTVVSGNGFARIDVKATGDVLLMGTYNNAFVSLDGISFRVN